MKSFFQLIFESILEATWSEVGPSWTPKWRQVGLKIEPKRPSKSNWPTIAKTFKSAVLSSKIKGSRRQDRGQVGSKIDQKSIQEAFKNKSQLGWHFGGLLGPTWLQNGAKLEGKLAPSWHQNLRKRGPKTMSKKTFKKC